MIVDASQISISVVFKQPDSDIILNPIVFYLKEWEVMNEIFWTKLECLALINTFDKVYHCFNGVKFTIYTDHEALMWLKYVKNLKTRFFMLFLKLNTFEYIEYLMGDLQMSKLACFYQHYFPFYATTHFSSGC